jgi:hypothetical protein
MARGDGLAFYFDTRASLIAAGPDAAQLLQPVTSLQGITDGPGNQGSANIAHTTGQAGTGSGQLSLPRSLAIGRRL